MAPFVRPAWAAPRQFILDTERGEIRFSYYLEGVAGHSSIKFSQAQFDVDLADLSRSTVAVSLSLSTIRAGFLPATEALKGPQLLDARNHPVIRFASSSIRPAGAGGHVSGDLSIRSVTRPERLTAQFIESIPQSDATAFGIQLSGQVDRHAYGVSGYSDFVGPQLDLRIRAYLIAA